MHSEVAQALAALLGRAVEVALADAQLRADLRRLAEAFLAASNVEAPAPATDAAETLVATAEEWAQPAPVLDSSAPPDESQFPEAPAAPLPKLTLGQPVLPRTSSITLPPRLAGAAVADLATIQARCLLKAEAARWAAARQRLLADGANYVTQIEPKDRDIIARAKALPDCFLWMCHRDGPSPANLELYEQVAGCFEAAAEALGVVKLIQDNPEAHQDELGAALDLMAEAQSALRVAAIEIDWGVDSDQAHIFNWLKTTTSQQQIFVQRHMRVDDPADPARWPELVSRIQSLDARLGEEQQRVRQRKKLLGKVRHKASLIAQYPEQAEGAWRILADTVDELVSDGLPPSNRELRELLLPVRDDLPDDLPLPMGAQRVLAEVDRYLASCSVEEGTLAAASTPQVQEIARIVGGKSMLLIGGENRPAAHRALEEAFCLGELIWIGSQNHQSVDDFRPYVARPDVALVLLAIRWSSHSYGDVKDFCDRYGKPLVRLPGGYNPNQVAAQIQAQCSQRLRV